jgi:hypothetical protein
VFIRGKKTEPWNPKTCPFHKQIHLSTPPFVQHHHQSSSNPDFVHERISSKLQIPILSICLKFEAPKISRLMTSMTSGPQVPWKYRQGLKFDTPWKIYIGICSIYSIAVSVLYFCYVYIYNYILIIYIL